MVIININIIAVGKIKEKYITEGIREFLKRLKPYAYIEINEVPDEKAPERLSAKEMEQVKAKEAEKIIRLIKPGQVVIALALDGKMMSSEELAEAIAQWGINGKSDLLFIIGGSLGLHKQILEKADLKLSFGKMTFPHQLVRLVLLEQIYRAFKINKGEPYHK